ncbi:hypothetical protein BDM02DRAFT_3131505 [Thelephora ganbajun]|uniref:Uncharacterized protein n=1 Tax=Thelephora ganbajun TaxID=370292 RepID=A0ACB6Z5N0_THEGA|nr:hypothetical protein BDM02DRAFT_3131505 [Thelephora ganbajun]
MGTAGREKSLAICEYTPRTLQGEQGDLGRKQRRSATVTSSNTSCGTHVHVFEYWVKSRYAKVVVQARACFDGVVNVPILLHSLENSQCRSLLGEYHYFRSKTVGEVVRLTDRAKDEGELGLTNLAQDQPTVEFPGVTSSGDSCVWAESFVTFPTAVIAIASSYAVLTKY